MSLVSAGERIPYRDAHGQLTNRGSMVVLAIQDKQLTVRISKGSERRINQKDWEEVEQFSIDLLRSGTTRQKMRSTRNVTYVLSLRGHLEVGGHKL
jgi:protein-L-isoaspartate O-methyltransferase